MTELLTQQDVQIEEAFEKSFEFENAGGSSSAKQFRSTWSFDDTTSGISDAEIQDELKATFDQKHIKEKGEVIVDIPRIDRLDDNYEQFITYESYSFMMLSLHPYFRGKFDTADIKTINQFRKRRDTIVETVSYSTLFSVIFYNIMYLEKRPILALTNNSRILFAMFQYGFVPNFLTYLVEKFYTTPNLNHQTRAITDKYNFNIESQSNPYFRKAFNDLLVLRDSSNKKTQKDIGIGTTTQLATNSNTQN